MYDRRMRMRATILAFLPVLLLLGAACGDDGAKTPTTTAGGNGGPAMTDEEYLKAICVGVQQLSDALLTKTNVQDITKVVKDFSASMKTLNPPADLQKYNQDFTKYLDDTTSEPTQLLTKAPPLPSDSVRQRLASKTSSISECKDVKFFNLPASTPAATAAASSSPKP